MGTMTITIEQRQHGSGEARRVLKRAGWVSEPAWRASDGSGRSSKPAGGARSQLGGTQSQLEGLITSWEGLRSSWEGLIAAWVGLGAGLRKPIFVTLRLPCNVVELFDRKPWSTVMKALVSGGRWSVGIRVKVTKSLSDI